MSAKHRAVTSAHTEHRVSRKIAKQRDRPAIKVLGAVAELGDQPPLVALSLLTLASGLLLRRRPLVRAGARMLASHAIATGAKSIIKSTIDRSRPARALRDGEPVVQKSHGRTSTDFNSFPSGHTAGAVSVAQALAHELPDTALAARAAASAVGAIQLPNGKHYISDVIAGAAIGWVAERIAGLALQAVERGLQRAADAGADRAALEETQAHPS